MPHNSLILIDEFDMALHPKAQAALLRYMDGVARDKHLTLIFSTHSSSVIKRAGRKRILLLQHKGEGRVTCLGRAFPAQALGDIVVDEDIQPDFLFFVEDYPARFLLEAMVELLRSAKDGNCAAPYYRVVPVGGFMNVIEFLTSSDQIFSKSVSRFAFLDEDVKSEFLKEAAKKKKYAVLKKFEDSKERIHFLPCTPEVGIIELLESDTIGHSHRLSHLLAKGVPQDLHPLMVNEDYKRITVPDKPRKQAKNRLEHLVSEIKKRTGGEQNPIIRAMMSYYVQKEFESDRGRLMSTLGSVFR